MLIRCKTLDPTGAGITSTTTFPSSSKVVSIVESSLPAESTAVTNAWYKLRGVKSRVVSKETVVPVEVQSTIIIMLYYII